MVDNHIADRLYSDEHLFGLSRCQFLLVGHQLARTPVNNSSIVVRVSLGIEHSLVSRGVLVGDYLVVCLLTSVSTIWNNFVIVGNESLAMIFLWIQVSLLDIVLISVGMLLDSGRSQRWNGLVWIQ